MSRKTLVALTVGWLFVGGTALAAKPKDPIPQHIHWAIRIALKQSKAAAVVTVMETAPEAGPVQLRVDRSLLGDLPTDLQVATRGFLPEDLVAGTQLLVFFQSTNDGWINNGRYELLKDGKIREYEAETFLAATEKHIAKKFSQNKARKGNKARKLRVIPVEDSAAGPQVQTDRASDRRPL